jgi:hypothetical protein
MVKVNHLEQALVLLDSPNLPMLLSLVARRVKSEDNGRRIRGVTIYSKDRKHTIRLSRVNVLAYGSQSSTISFTIGKANYKDEHRKEGIGNVHFEYEPKKKSKTK